MLNCLDRRDAFIEMNPPLKHARLGVEGEGN